MGVAVREAAAADDHGVVEQRPLAFADAAHLLAQVDELLHVPAIDLAVLLDLVLLVLMMRILVVPGRDAFDDLREVLVRHAVGEHERRQPGGIRRSAAELLAAILTQLEATLQVRGQ